MSLNPRITDWQGMRVWIVGASSGIGAALAERLGASGAQLALSARRDQALREIAREEDLILPLDVTQIDDLQEAKDEILTTWGGLDLVIYCAGVYQPMRSWALQARAVQESLDINLKGFYNLLDAVLPLYLQQRSGHLAIVASVAGYTGLPKALAYGPGKAALINLAQILYSDLSARGIGVYLINPGFVATRLTEQNDFEMPALVTPDEAAIEILKGMGKGQFEIHFPKRFTLWMKLLSRLPDRLRFTLLKKAVGS
jgi:short-subunit dehydrogenase